MAVSDGLRGTLSGYEMSVARTAALVDLIQRCRVAGIAVPAPVFDHAVEIDACRERFRAGTAEQASAPGRASVFGAGRDANRERHSAGNGGQRVLRTAADP